MDMVRKEIQAAIKKGVKLRRILDSFGCFKSRDNPDCLKLSKRFQVFAKKFVKEMIAEGISLQDAFTILEGCVRYEIALTSSYWSYEQHQAKKKKRAR